MKKINQLPRSPTSTIIKATNEPSHYNLYHKDIGKDKYLKHHTIILDSHYRRAGSTLTRAVFDITKDVEIRSTKSVLFADSFLLNDATIFNNCFYYVKIGEISQPLSYTSENRGSDNILIVNKGATYFNNNGLGLIPIYDRHIFQGKQLTIEVVCPDVDISTLSSHWVLKLVIIEEDNKDV